MKFFVYLVFIILFLNENVALNEQLEDAIEQLMENFDRKNSIHVHLITSSINNYPSDNLIKSIHKKSNAVSIGRKPRKAKLVIIFNQNDILEVKNANEFYLIVCPETANVSSIFETIWNKNYVLNVNIIIMKKEKVKLLTFFPFSEKNCNNTKTIKIVNEFYDQKWHSKIFYPNKLSNFHQCILSLGLSYFSGVKKREHKNGTVEYFGSDIKIVKELERRLNFTNNMTTMFDNDIDVLENRTYDYAAGWFFLLLDKSQKFDYSQAYCFVPFVVVVPPGKIFKLI